MELKDRFVAQKIFFTRSRTRATIQRQRDSVLKSTPRKDKKQTSTNNANVQKRNKGAERVG